MRGSRVLRLYCAAVATFLLAPVFILIATSFTGSDTVAFPPTTLSLRWYAKLLSHLADSPGVKSGLFNAISISAQVAVIATTMAVVAGVAAAYAFHVLDFRGKGILRQAFMLPVILPQLVTGVALLLFFSEIGLMGARYRLVIGHSILVLPYVLLTVSATLEVVGIELEEAAIGLGAGPFKAFFLVTLPLLMPAIAAGALFAFIISFNTFTVSYFLFSGEARPLPMWVYEYMTYFQDPTLAALSTMMIVVTLAIIVAFDRLVGIRRASE
jgi:putative spermidine/putrescine transport system permease protein